MIKIIADDKIPFLKGLLEPYAEMTYLPGRHINQEAAMKADALLIRTRTKCTRTLLEGTNVRFIGTATIGYDHIDTHYCENKNIKWINTPGCNSSSVQQYIASALLTIAERNHFNLKDKTLGIIGVGNVGSKVEIFARCVGMQVILNDPPRARKEGASRFVSLEKLLKESDIVTLHVPLNFVGKDKTYHLIDDSIRHELRKDTWLINSSRGEVVNTVFLKEALRSGKLAGVVIDVWENEPDIDQELMNRAFLATPHIAGYSADGKANGTAMVVKELCDFFNFPLVEWYPTDIPDPDNKEISVDGRGKSVEDILREAVFHTYNISEDDKKIRAAPLDFEKQRGNYPVRREFNSYRVKLIDCPAEVIELFKNIGFNLQDNNN